MQASCLEPIALAALSAAWAEVERIKMHIWIIRVLNRSGNIHSTPAQESSRVVNFNLF